MNSRRHKNTERKILLDQIDSAFADASRPPVCRDIVTQEDFEKAFMGEELANTIHRLYDYDEDEVHYLTPFLMKSYLDHYGENYEKDVDLAHYLFWFNGFREGDDFIRRRHLSFYSRFDAEQRKCVCSFLTFLVKYEMDESFIDEDVVEYWCE